MTWTNRTAPPPSWATDPTAAYAFTDDFTSDFDAPHSAEDWTDQANPPPAWGQGTQTDSDWNTRTPPPPSWATE